MCDRVIFIGRTYCSFGKSKCDVCQQEHKQFIDMAMPNTGNECWLLCIPCARTVCDDMTAQLKRYAVDKMDVDDIFESDEGK